MSTDNVSTPVEVPAPKQLTPESAALVMHLLKGGRLSLGYIEQRYGAALTTLGVGSEGFYVSYKYDTITPSIRRNLDINENGERIIPVGSWPAYCLDRAVEWVGRDIASSLDLDC
jgi:hypothetical protein